MRARTPERRAGPTIIDRSSGWQRRYPALLNCLIHGTNPTQRDVEILVRRMHSEIGKAGGGAPAHLDRRLLRAARAALEGSISGKASIDGSESD